MNPNTYSQGIWKTRDIYIYIYYIPHVNTKEETTQHHLRGANMTPRVG